MDYHFLGSSDLKVSDFCLGTMTWGQQNTESDAHAQLDLAIAQGINFIDTAEMYPVPASAETQGRTEAYLGSWLKNQKRDALIIATKVIGKSGMNWIRGGGLLNQTHIRQAIEDSLKRLNTDYVDLYQIHWPDRYTPTFGNTKFIPDNYVENTPILETMETMDALIKEGKIRHYGLSNESPYGLSQYLQLSEKYNLPKPVSIQNAYNLLNRVYEVNLLECCYHANVELMPYSVLAFGFLTGKYRSGALPEGSRLQRFPEFPRRYKGKPNLEEAVEAYAELAKEIGLVNLAIGFIQAQPWKKSIIIGATNLKQLQENIVKTPLSQDIINAIDAIHLRYPNPCP